MQKEIFIMRKEIHYCGKGENFKILTSFMLKAIDKIHLILLYKKAISQGSLKYLINLIKCLKVIHDL